MFKVSPANLKGVCQFEGSCEAAANGGCPAIAIEMYDQDSFEAARTQGLNPHRNSNHHDDFHEHPGRVILCEGATQKFDIIFAVKRIFGETFIEGEELAGHQEAHGVLAREIDIDDVQTDQGFAMLDRLTSGSRPPYADHHALALNEGVLQVVPIYNLEQTK